MKVIAAGLAAIVLSSCATRAVRSIYPEGERSYITCDGNQLSEVQIIGSGVLKQIVLVDDAQKLPMKQQYAIAELDGTPTIMRREFIDEQSPEAATYKQAFGKARKTLGHAFAHFYTALTGPQPPKPQLFITPCRNPARYFSSRNVFIPDDSFK